MQSNNKSLRTMLTSSYQEQQNMGAAYGPYNNQVQAPRAQASMTYDDVIARTGLLVGITFVAAMITWFMARSAMEITSTGVTITDPGMISTVNALGVVGMLVGLGVALFSMFRPVMNPALAIAYSAGQGLLLGGVSAFFESMFPGIVANALIGTVLVFGGMLALFKFGVIRNSPMFTKIVVGAGFGIFGLLIVNMISGMFGLNLGLFAAPGQDPSMLQWIISIGLVIWAAVSFVLDFDMIKHGVEGGAPKKFAWAGAFGLTAGLIFLYWNLLRLASYFMSE
ncbi:Bax inhibitor-1/YccA family protein [Salininema proteolyticum]|uniref:Bax inhibitor-1/YccA family protein n=1 Tax=Salininema proteolyticum TaxID=1607685 RepID=A0ABV8U3U8_9ACTN